MNVRSLLSVTLHLSLIGGLGLTCAVCFEARSGGHLLLDGEGVKTLLGEERGEECFREEVDDPECLLPVSIEGLFSARQIFAVYGTSFTSAAVVRLPSWVMPLRI